MRALVICNGEPPSRTLLKRLARGVDIVVAADGGANAARALGVRPDVIIGDLDSLLPSTRRFFSSSLIIEVKRQDNTDLEKALDALCARTVDDVVIVGATGRRLDFTLGNLAVLWKYAAQMTITVEGDGWKAFPVRGPFTHDAARGTIVSLIPCGHCSGITVRGLHYPLTDARMGIGEIGVSNRVVRSPFSVTVRRGRMLVVMLVAKPGRR